MALGQRPTINDGSWPATNNGWFAGQDPPSVHGPWPGPAINSWFLARTHHPFMVPGQDPSSIHGVDTGVLSPPPLASCFADVKLKFWRPARGRGRFYRCKTQIRDFPLPDRDPGTLTRRDLIVRNHCTIAHNT